MDYLVFIELFVEFEAVEEGLITICFFGDKCVKLGLDLGIFKSNLLRKDILNVFLQLFLVFKHGEKDGRLMCS